MPKFVQRSEERVGAQREDVVDAVVEVVRELGAGAELLQERLRSAHGPDPEGPVVDELDGGRERRGVAIEVERSDHRRDRARRRRGAGALGAVGEQLGVALVEAGDGVAEAVGGEELGRAGGGPRASTSTRTIASLS